MSEQRIEIAGTVYTVGRGYEPKPEDIERLNAALAALQRHNWRTLPKATHFGRTVAAERIAPGLSIAFDAAGRAYRWQPVEPLHFADEAIEPGDALTVLPDGRVRLADRAEAARRAAVERAIERHAPPDDDDAPLAAAGDGADAAIVARAEA